MASRKTRTQIAQQTIEILERGWYMLPDGTTVSLGDRTPGESTLQAFADKFSPPER